MADIAGRHTTAATAIAPAIAIRARMLPIIRGVVALGESLTIGFRALAISANYAAQEEGEEGDVDRELSRGQLAFAFAIAIGFALLLFNISPTSFLCCHSSSSICLMRARSSGARTECQWPR